MDEQEIKALMRALNLPPEMAGAAEAARASGLKQLMTLGRWKGLDAVVWDALGECLVVRFQAGRVGRADMPVDWEIPTELAAALLSELQRAFLEKGNAAPTKQ